MPSLTFFHGRRPEGTHLDDAIHRHLHNRPVLGQQIPAPAARRRRDKRTSQRWPGVRENAFDYSASLPCRSLSSAWAPAGHRKHPDGLARPHRFVGIGHSEGGRAMESAAQAGGESIERLPKLLDRSEDAAFRNDSGACGLILSLWGPKLGASFGFDQSKPGHRCVRDIVV